MVIMEDGIGDTQEMKAAESLKGATGRRGFRKGTISIPHFFIRL